MNTWYSRIDKPDRPDFVLFDLDPTPEVPWEQTVEVALILKGLLDALGLESFPKTSGGKGFHVLVPLDRRSTYEDTRAFSEHVAGAIARTASEARNDGVGESAPARRADRLEPERRGQDDCERLLGAAEAGRARVDATRLERGERQAESVDLHDGCRARARAEPGRPFRPGCSPHASRSPRR